MHEKDISEMGFKDRNGVRLLGSLLILLVVLSLSLKNIVVLCSRVLLLYSYRLICELV